MLLIADALTVVYLRPYLKAQGFTESEVDRIVVWYDPSAVATRNDKAADADSGFDRGAISYDSWRRAHGFSSMDAPTPNELAEARVPTKCPHLLALRPASNKAAELNNGIAIR
jgi:hypothetical protein